MNYSIFNPFLFRSDQPYIDQSYVDQSYIDQYYVGQFGGKRFVLFPLNCTRYTVYSVHLMYNVHTSNVSPDPSYWFNFGILGEGIAAKNLFLMEVPINVG